MPAFTFEKIERPVEPNTGALDEDSTLFGQGRSPERQERDAQAMSILAIAVVVTMIGAVVYGVVHYSG